MTKYIEIDKAIDIVGGYFMVDNDAERFLEDEMRENGTDLIDRVLEIINRCGLHNAYERPSFWYNKGKDYKVIDTKYHRGYDQALADIEEAVNALKGER